MKCEVINNFYDEQEQKERLAGDAFECTESRFKAINKALPGWVRAIKTTRTTKAKK